MTAALERVETTTPVPRVRPGRRLLTFVGVLALVIGLGSVAGGIAGAVFTWNTAAGENITTPDDASIPETPVRGVFTMYSQADIITHHQMERTEGLRYAEMPREVPMVDETGAPVLDENGDQVMGPNEARMSWITATTLTTALNLGIMAYMLSAFAIVVGLALAGCGVVFLALRQPAEA
jgi:hypothetical protein